MNNEYLITISANNESMSTKPNNLEIGDYITILTVLVIPFFLWLTKRQKDEILMEVKDLLIKELKELSTIVNENKEKLEKGSMEAKYCAEIMSLQLEALDKKVSKIETFLEKHITKPLI